VAASNLAFVFIAFTIIVAELGGREASFAASKSSICTSRSVRAPSRAPGCT
jgi:hypothetical protein